MNTGKRWSQETKDKISRALKGRAPKHTVKSCGKRHAACKVCKPSYHSGRIIVSHEYDPVSPPNKGIIRRLLNAKLGEEKCFSCGWNERRNNGACPLEIHHVDGNRNNWAWDNLELLCPNCHSLTAKYRRYKLVPPEGFEPST